jgi:RNA polymerase sigma factor (TIGR02999 family)
LKELWQNVAMQLMQHSSKITELLEQFRLGQANAAETLIPLLYDELRRKARRHLARERRDHSVEATALVHEVYIKLFGNTTVKWQNRAHFFAVSSQIMRRILVDYARSRRAVKHGGAWTNVVLDEAIVGSFSRPKDFLDLDEAITHLGKLDARQSKIVEMRFFGGLNEDEIADVLGISVRTVKRDWRLARAWLYERLAK